MNLKTISRLILFVKDIDVVKDFYHSTLGLPILNEESSDFITLDGGGCQLSLHKIPPKYASDDIEPREDSYTKLVFQSDNVEADREELLKLGIRMKGIHRWKDIVFCDGADPEGNIFQISNREK